MDCKGTIIFFRIGGSWKSWGGSQNFFMRNREVPKKSRDICIGWLQILKGPGIGQVKQQNVQSQGNVPGGGGTDLERGYGVVRPWRPPFHASPAARKGPISSKRVSSQDPLLRKFGNFSLYSLIFHPNFSSQAPNFGNFQLTSPQNWKFSAHKPPNCEIFRSQAPIFRGKLPFASPTLRKSGPHTPTWKKVECPPPRGNVYCHYYRYGHFWNPIISVLFWQKRNTHNFKMKWLQ